MVFVFTLSIFNERLKTSKNNNTTTRYKYVPYRVRNLTVGNDGMSFVFIIKIFSERLKISKNNNTTTRCN